MAVIGLPLQTTWFIGAFTVGVGLTVMEKDVAVPEQPLAVGVTVTVPEVFAFVVFVAVNAAILPVPFAANPIVVLVFVQA